MGTAMDRGFVRKQEAPTRQQVASGSARRKAVKIFRQQHAQLRRRYGTLYHRVLGARVH
jgi:hypothetical protein